MEIAAELLEKERIVGSLQLNLKSDVKEVRK